ncbi:GTPase [Candidatus Hepatoplasma crinochetorum]|uniref:GTPase n=1 Tax=Candidatus Hepatoplasma crinochetorum TaxID=295596 RepID=UPI0030878B2F|nr:MAG: ribosome biogenesis GTPase A [Candidatus Hepatoplasma crinochetorum]
MNKQLQWFPGHMQKTLDQLFDLKKNINLIIVVLDARAPKSSFIDIFDDFLKDKKVIICLNKRDLVSKEKLKKWVNFYKKKFTDAITISLKEEKNLAKINLFKILKKYQKENFYTKVIVIGIPNVGKSNLLNVLIEKNSAKVQNIAGVTKNLGWYQKDQFLFLDTPGVLVPKFENDLIGAKIVLIGGIKINLVPIEEVIRFMFEIFKEKNILLPFTSFEDLQKKIKIEKEQTKTYLNLINDYQKGKYGKFILD